MSRRLGKKQTKRKRLKCNRCGWVFATFGSPIAGLKMTCNQTNAGGLPCRGMMRRE